MPSRYQAQARRGVSSLARRILKERSLAESMGPAAAGQIEVFERFIALHGGAAESFPQQVEAARSRHPMEVWQCSRRSGKTTGVMLHFDEDGREHPDSQYLYIAKTGKSAKNITWSMARKYNNAYKLGWVANVADQCFYQPNGARLIITGADDPQLVDTFHGGKNRAVFLDEAPFWQHIDIEQFCEEVITPTLADEKGVLRMMSRPGYRRAGFFWECAHGKHPEWNVRKWSWEDNPHVRDNVRAFLAARIAANPEIVATAAFRRNWCNEWVEDDTALAYKFSRELSGVDAWEVKPGDAVVLGIDLGWFDASAFSVITWSDRHPYVVELESYSLKEMLLESVAARCRMYLDEYPGIIMVGDPSRRQAFEELRKRYNLPIIAAEKQDKRHWIDQINSDYQTGRIKIVKPEKSQHVDEMNVLSMSKTRTGLMKETHGQANDACDAFLYAYRYAYHYLHNEEERAAEAAEAARANNEEAKLEALAEQQHGEGSLWL